MPILLGLAPEVVVIALAVFALLLYLGYSLLRNILGGLFSSWGAISRFIDSTLVSALDAAYNLVKGWLEAAIRPVVGLFSHPAANTDALIRADVNAHQAALNRDRYITGTLIPQSANAAAAAGIQAAGAVNYRIDSQVIPATETAVANLLHGIQDADLGILNLQSQVTALRARVDAQPYAAEIAAIESALGLVGAQLSSITAEAAQLGTGIQTVAEEAAAAQGYTDTQVRAGVAAAEQSSAAFTLAQLAPIAATVAQVESFVNECGDPMCSWFNSGDNLLNGITAALSLAPLVVLVEAAISDPAGTADAFAGVVDEVKGLGESALSLVGIGNL